MSSHRAVVERHDGETILVEAGTRIECTVALSIWAKENFIDGDDAYVCKVSYRVYPNDLVRGSTGPRQLDDVLQPNMNPAPTSATSGAARKRARAAKAVAKLHTSTHGS